MYPAWAPLRPKVVAGRARRLVQRTLRRLRRTERRVVSLAAAGEPAGRALLSYILDPFLLPAGRPVPHSHTHFWESLAIGRTLQELGFAVDVIHWTNRTFVPRGPYALCIDVRLNLERLAPLLGPDCLKILHAETAHRDFHNRAQRQRFADLEARRGFALARRTLLEPNRAIEYADCATVLGNEFTLGTYRFAAKPLFRLPLSQPVLYPFPEGKDFAAAARRYLWFGSLGPVHKGLDLVLETFAALPDHHLTVCGPLDREREFERAYWPELYGRQNIETVGWVDIAGERFRTLAADTLALVYPTCSEGCSGSVVTSMHAGLIPVVSRYTGVDVTAERGVELADCALPTLRQAVVDFSRRPAPELEATARRAWEHARLHHTRERFAAAFRAALLEILSTFRPELGARLAS